MTNNPMAQEATTLLEIGGDVDDFGNINPNSVKGRRAADILPTIHGRHVPRPGLSAGSCADLKRELTPARACFLIAPGQTE